MSAHCITESGHHMFKSKTKVLQNLTSHCSSIDRTRCVIDIWYINCIKFSWVLKNQVLKGILGYMVYTSLNSDHIISVISPSVTGNSFGWHQLSSSRALCHCCTRQFRRSSLPKESWSYCRWWKLLQIHSGTYIIYIHVAIHNHSMFRMMHIQ